jgi:SOS-response transcriptional repressor LexA
MAQLEIYRIDHTSPTAGIPVFGSYQAGFPSPATDYTGDRIDLNEVFIRDPGNTYYARVSGYLLLEGELGPGDALLFDTTLRPRKGDLAVCNIDGEVMLKFIDRREGDYCLVDGADERTETLDGNSSSFVMGIVTTLFIRRRREKGRRTLTRWGVRSKAEQPTKKRAIRWGFTPETSDDDRAAVDLNTELVKHPVYSGFGLVVGQSLREDAIDDGDSVIIDTIIDPQEGDLVVSYREGEFMIKYIELHKDGLYLAPGNREYKPIRISEEEDTRKLVWGIVTYSIKQLRKPAKKINITYNHILDKKICDNIILYIMADGNSFYCSCETSQKPWLDGRPMIVASNSDKIAIALNRPAKALGLKLGDLLFEPEIARKVREHQVVVFSSNYEMYGHISADMHAALGSFVQDIEIASIDPVYTIRSGGYENSILKRGR